MIKSRDENKSKARSKKGFIFTLLALLVISFMVIEISIYFSAYQIRQESEPLKIRTKVVEEFATQLTSENIRGVSYISAYNAVHTLAKDAVTQPVTGTSTENISNVIRGLFWNGTRQDTGIVLIANGTLESWKTSLESLANKVGIYLTITTSDFKVNQSDPWTVQINYTFTYSLQDNYTNTRIADVYNVSVNVPIYGAEDPLFKNQTRTACPTCTRNIFNYAGTVNTSKIDLTNALGKGWFYGSVFQGGLVNVFNETIFFNPENKKMMLYTGDRNLFESYSNIFGAAIYVGSQSPSYNTISVPFISLEGSLSGQLPPGFGSLPVLIRSDSDTDYTSGNHSIYNIEDVRNFIACAYYTTNPDAPSFFDRLSAGRTNPNVRLLNSSFGIETSLVGLSSWAMQNRSSIDHVYYNYAYYNLTSGTRVMGMTGCKNYDMCKDATSPKFLVDSSHISWYGLNDLVCSGNNAGRCG